MILKKNAKICNKNENIHLPVKESSSEDSGLLELT